MNPKGIVVAFLSALIAVSCATTVKEQASSPAPVQEQPVPEQQDSEGRQSAASADTSAAPSATEEQAAAEPAVAESTAQTEPPPDTGGLVKPSEEGAIAVSEEVFAKTFTDIEAFIGNLSHIIRDEKYDEWAKYLTKEYIDTYSDPEKLNELSKQPLLQKYNVKLRTLKDYFTYVVVQSRTNVSLDDLVFLSENRVKAISVINGQRVILYLLEKSGGSWKIGTF